MFKLIILVVGCIYVATVLGQTQGLTCYHCYDFISATSSLRSSENNVYGGRLERCAKGTENWTTWACPAQYTVCVILRASVGNEAEILRSCARKDICETYRPPSGVKMEFCRECNKTLCNEDLETSTTV